MDENSKQFTNYELLWLLKTANSRIEYLQNKSIQLSENLMQTTIDLERSEQRATELEDIVGKDELSGLLNRRAFNEKKTIEPEEITVMIDLDNFKHINDKHLHTIGDEVISNMGNIILDTVYPKDLSFRYGGDEFIIIFRDCPYDKVVEKLQLINQRYRDVCNSLIKEDFTISFGIYSPYLETPTIEAVNVADKIMYKKKRWKKIEKGIYRGIRERRQC